MFCLFLDAEPTQDELNAGVLTWNFVDLKPFESRDVVLSLALNSPMDDPPLNGDDILSFIARVEHDAEDETPSDNVFVLEETLVNSFDPNDKTCLQGEVITPDMVGDYVHYMIRFENNGTADAINVRVVDTLDASVFDLSSLRLVDASHSVETIMNDGNIVEFIFENINLPFDDATNDGYVLFKIKTLSTLALGDVLENSAGIYFDFNDPIQTNTATTLIDNIIATGNIEQLDDLLVYPNPVHSKLYFSNLDLNAGRYEMYTSNGLLVQEGVLGDAQSGLEVKNLAAGVYMVILQFEDGQVVRGQFVKG